MSRDDSMLYSGLTSPRKAAIEAKREEVKKLDPKADAVLAEIAKMKKEVTSVEKILIDDSLTDEQRIRKMERTRDRYEDLTNLEKRMRMILGVAHG